MGELRLMGITGDTKLAWDKDTPEEVEIARAAFDGALLTEGTRAFRIEGRSRRGEQITTFDPDAERILLVPAIAGG